MQLLDNIYNRLQRKTNTTSFIPQMDGLRFLAIALVVFQHVHDFVINKTPVAFSDNPAINHLWFFALFDNNGRKGVLIFFVISGFILAMPFAKQFWQEAQHVNLKKYFLRRLTRLEPPYIFNMVACTFLLIWFGHPDLAGEFPHLNFFSMFPMLGASLIYMHNIIFPFHVASVNPVAWSLEIEVQFYLLVPLLVLLLKLPKFYRRSILVFFIVLFTALQKIFPTQILTIYLFIQYFLLGFLVLDFYLSGFKLTINPFVSCMCGMLMMVYIVYVDIYQNPYTEFIFIAIICAFFLLVLTDDFWKKIFSLRFLTTIGGMCYSLYLWHDPIMSGFGNRTIYLNVTHSYILTELLQFTLLLPLIILFSTFFYVCIEQPCMDKDCPKKLWRFVTGLVRPVKQIPEINTL